MLLPFLLTLSALALPPWADLQSVDASIGLDEKTFPLHSRVRHVADRCWLRKPVAIGLHRAASELRLLGKRLVVERCYIPRSPEFGSGAVVQLRLTDRYRAPLPVEEGGPALKKEGFQTRKKGVFRWHESYPVSALAPGDLTTSDKAAEQLMPISQ